jgi:hypothetical protein
MRLQIALQKSTENEQVLFLDFPEETIYLLLENQILLFDFSESNEFFMGQPKKPSNDLLDLVDINFGNVKGG